MKIKKNFVSFKAFDKKIDFCEIFAGVRVWSGITISDLAAAMNRDVDEVFEAIFRTEYRDVFESPNQGQFLLNIFFLFVTKIH